MALPNLPAAASGVSSGITFTPLTGFHGGFLGRFTGTIGANTIGIPAGPFTLDALGSLDPAAPSTGTRTVSAEAAVVQTRGHGQQPSLQTIRLPKCSPQAGLDAGTSCWCRYIHIR